MTTNDTSAPTVFRASRRARRIVLLSMLPLAVLVIPVAALATVFPAALPFVVAFALTAAAGVAYAILYAVRTRVEFGGGAYRQVFALTSRSFTVAEVATVMPVESLDYGLQSAPHLFVVGRSGRGLLQLNDQMVERTQLEAIVDDLLGRGVPLEHVQGRLTVGQFARAHPGVLPWQLAHRVQFLVLVSVGTLLIMGGAAALSVAGVVGSLS